MKVLFETLHGFMYHSRSPASSMLAIQISFLPCTRLTCRVGDTHLGEFDNTDNTARVQKAYDLK